MDQKSVVCLTLQQSVDLCKGNKQQYHVHVRTISHKGI